MVIEDKLWSLLEIHRLIQYKQLDCASFVSKLQEVAIICDEWWEVTHNDNINSLECVLASHDLFRRAVRQAMILNLLVITFVYAYSIENSDIVESKLLSKIKKMLYFVH